MTSLGWKVSYRLWNGEKGPGPEISQDMKESEIEGFIKGIEAFAKASGQTVAWQKYQITEIGKGCNRAWVDCLELENKHQPRYFQVESFHPSLREPKEEHWRYSKISSTETTAEAAVEQIKDHACLWSEVPRSQYPQVTEPGYLVRNFLTQKTEFIPRQAKSVVGYRPENKTYKPDASQRPIIPQGGIGGSAIGPQSPITTAPQSCAAAAEPQRIIEFPSVIEHCELKANTKLSTLAINK